MARLLHQLVEPPHPCAYLNGVEAQLEVRVMVEVTEIELDALLSRGWRRFGAIYFRPACTACAECVTLRIRVDSFMPSKSQRRAVKNARHLRRAVRVPTVDDERLALFKRWHVARESTRGWEPGEMDEERYAADFAFPHPAAREVTFRDPENDRLVGLSIVDETPTALSAVYFFWDPERAPGSLGVANIVTLVAEAHTRGLTYVYLGYRVVGCASLTYKSKYSPHELLIGRPGFATAPEWAPGAKPTESAT